MEQVDLIIVEVFSEHYKIELTQIEELEDFGLIEIYNENGLKYIHSNNLPQIEKVLRFHNELNINKEGIEVVLNLLERLENTNQELKYFKDKLKLYE